jgi:hypothetical protein
MHDPPRLLVALLASLIVLTPLTLRGTAHGRLVALARTIPTLLQNENHEEVVL